MKKRKQEEDRDEEEELEEEEEVRTARKRKKQVSSSGGKKGSSSSTSGEKTLHSLITNRKSPTTYGDVHRALLQYLMVVKVVEEEILSKIAEKLGKPSHVTIKHFIDEINEKLSSEDMYLQIKRREMLEEETCPRVWGLVNTRSDEASKYATPLEDWQLVVFKTCLSQLAKAEDGAIFSDDIIRDLNVGNEIKKTNKEVASTLQRLAALGWLRETKKDFFTAGRRTMLELSEILREKGALECPISKQIVIQTRSYKAWLHRNGH